MSKDYSFEKRKYVIGAVAVAVVTLYIVRVFTLQILSDDYRQRADSNAFRKEVLFPSRGLILDRKGRLMVYNEPSYNINVVMQDQHGIDTLDFCNILILLLENIHNFVIDSVSFDGASTIYKHNILTIFLKLFA